ncbi:MAG: helix-turn-helix transcriptional regulator [Chloroflexi bacterium]|nr:helix-turn-helix transcriptional regulator [Chloroflexota bacterium]
MPAAKTNKITRDLFLGFIRLHILYHASQDAIFGLDMIRELATHGYQLSPGTLYPILHGMEGDGFLRSDKQVVDGKIRKNYYITKDGRTALKEAIIKVRVLMDEVGIISS